MKSMTHLLLLQCCFSLLSCQFTIPKNPILHADICIQAARLGNEVILIEPTGHPGGMMAEGIVEDIRFGSARVIGGIAREVYTAIEAYY